MDQWIQKVSLPVVLFLAIVAVYCSTQDVSCWSPAHFTSSHILHTISVCSGNYSRKYKLFSGKIPKENDTEEDRMWSGVVRVKSFHLQKLLLAEAMLVCSVYCIIRWLVKAGCLDAKFPHTLHMSFAKVPFYLVVQVVACICWIVLAINTTYDHDWSGADARFMCDFKIRRLGNIQRYTVQCTEKGEEVLRVALRANFGLCLVVAITKLIHLIMVFVVQPLLMMKSLVTSFAEKNINPCMFALSDLYFAMLASGQNILSPQQEKSAEPEMEYPLVSQ